MSKSPLEQLREDGFAFAFGHKIVVDPDKGIWVHGCDCAEQLPDWMVPELITALTAYRRHLHNAAEKRKG